MMMSVRYAVILLLLASATAAAQGVQRPPVAMAPRNVFFEPVTFPSEDSSLVRIDVPYRIERDFFISHRELTSGTRGGFQRRGEFLVELIDPAGLSRDRCLKRIEVDELEEPLRTEDRKEWIQGIASLRVPPGTYKVSVEVTDLHSQQRFADSRRSVTAAPLRRDSLSASLLFFVLPSAQRSAARELELLNFGGDLLFGSSASAYVEVFPADGTDTLAAVSVRFSIGEPEGRKDADSVIDMEVPLLRNRRLDPVERSETNPCYAVTDTSSHTAGVVIPLPAEMLLLRGYDVTLTVRVGSRTATVTRPVKVVWPDMPMSLRDVDYALLALRFFVPDRVVDSLSSGSFEDRRDNLEAFWNSRDQTPATAYNELMTQYYRRVDHALKAFGTLKQPDGTRTDRGRIYILYGQPTRIDRSLDPGLGFSETWVYEKLRRSFVFVDRARNGTYVLEAGGT